MVDEAMILAIAGADTTAATLEVLTYHVLSDKEMFKRLRAELDQAIPDPTQFPDPVKLDNLPFLNALIEETLRLYPSATHRQDRLAPDEDLVYEYPDGRSVTIPRGTVVGMTAMLVNRSPLWYENPDEFRPERYLENPKSFKRMLTFSKGARQCLGINLAYQELQTFTAGIFRKYGPYDPKLKEQSGPTLELHETTLEDVKTHADYVTPGLRPGSKGVQVRIRRD
jgi:cytochrome P450